MIPPYPKVSALGTHRFIAPLLEELCVVQEKVDGSQFSFTRTDEGFLLCRSKGVVLDNADPGMFHLAVVGASLVHDKLTPGLVYRGEFLAKSHHNVLAYDRTPTANVILWDIERPDGTLMTHAEMQDEAERIGLEVVPNLGYLPAGSSLADVEALHPKTSCLGGEAEGVVVKRASPIPGMHAKVVAAKFREVQGTRPARARTATIATQLGHKYCPPARWAKAVAHLRDAGLLKGDNRDIGPLIKEALADMETECAEAIKADLYAAAGKELRSAAIGGLAAWYQQELARGHTAWDARYPQEPSVFAEFKAQQKEQA